METVYILLLDSLKYIIMLTHLTNTMQQACIYFLELENSMLVISTCIYLHCEWVNYMNTLVWLHSRKWNIWNKSVCFNSQEYAIKVLFSSNLYKKNNISFLLHVSNSQLLQLFNKSFYFWSFTILKINLDLN